MQEISKERYFDLKYAKENSDYRFIYSTMSSIATTLLMAGSAVTGVGVGVLLSFALSTLGIYGMKRFGDRSADAQYMMNDMKRYL